MTNQESPFDIAQICDVFQYIKDHENDPTQVNNSRHWDQPTEGCDIYTAITTKKIPITFEQFDFFFRQSGLIQETRTATPTEKQDFNSSDFQRKPENWQGRSIRLTGLGHVIHCVFCTINPK